jgi:hypothetical protein
VAALLGLLPAGLVALLPLIFSGGGLATALLGFLPNLRQYAVIGLAVLLGLAVIYGQTEKANYESEKAGRIADAAVAAEAARIKVAEAKKDADAREAQLRADLGANRATADIYRDMIANAPPSSLSCPPTAGDRAASRGLGVLLADPRSAGASPAK